MNLSKLENRPGARKKKKILGKGIGSGHGKTSGKGHKGQWARSGPGVRLGWEGGQMPLLRRIPKRGFNNTKFQIPYVIVNVGDLEIFKAQDEITPEKLKEKGLIKGRAPRVKVLGAGDVKQSFVVKAHLFTKSAKEKIEKAQGKWIEL
jgi:large subunit ribosomal protein L15